MTAVVDALIGLPPWLILLLVFALPAAESGLLIGVFIPGEIAVLVGGVVAHGGALPLWTVIVAASLGAAVGDQVGFELGRRHGGRLVGRLGSGRSGDMERTYAFLRRRGGIAVALGRWVAVLRALIPGAAGSIGMARGQFTAYNVTGGVLWATTVAVAGYLAGASFRALERDLGAGADLLFLLAIAAGVVWATRRWWRRALPSNRHGSRDVDGGS